MAKPRFLKPIIAAALILSVVAAPVTYCLSNMTTVSAASSSDIQSNIDSLEAEQESLQKQQEEVANQLASLKEDKEKQLEYKQALDEQMTSIQEEVNVINKKIDALDEKIKAKQKEIEADEKVITDTFNQLKERIRALYLAGEASTLEILLNADSIADFADKVEVMKSITSHDAELIDTLKSELNKVKDQKAEIEQSRQEVADARTELEDKEKEVKKLVEESNAVIAEINASEDEANSLSNQLKSEFDARSDELAQAYKDYQAAKSKEQQAAEQEASKDVVTVNDDDYEAGYDGGSSGGSNFTEGSGTANGQFIWPAPGTTIITSGVGPRWGTNHNGIDISGSNAYGSPIVAADGGTVIVAVHSGWGGGYGLHVMIDHGNGYTTVYGHASSVLVNVGDKVSQGQTIAYIGSTGDSTGPHLHFEIRKNGAIVDPELYVSA